MAKTKKTGWLVRCGRCKTTLELPITRLSVQTKEAEFIRQPEFVCGWCGELCVTELVWKKVDSPAPPLKKEGAGVYITEQHAYSLRELVKWFKIMLAKGNMPDTPGRSDELTAGYCDELLIDLDQ